MPHLLRKYPELKIVDSKDNTDRSDDEGDNVGSVANEREFRLRKLRSEIVDPVSVNIKGFCGQFLSWDIIGQM